MKIKLILLSVIIGFSASMNAAMPPAQPPVTQKELRQFIAKYTVLRSECDSLSREVGNKLFLLAVDLSENSVQKDAASVFKMLLQDIRSVDVTRKQHACNIARSQQPDMVYTKKILWDTYRVLYRLVHVDLANLIAVQAAMQSSPCKDPAFQAWMKNGPGLGGLPNIDDI